MPSQNPFYPKIIDKVDGAPAYGQVLLAETIGTGMFVLMVLFIKLECEQNPQNAYNACLTIPVGLYAIVTMFSEISGGIVNPGFIIAGICWQNLTWMYYPDTSWSRWTKEYAAVYVIGPFLGAFIAGFIYNLQRRVVANMEKTGAELAAQA